MRALQTLYYFVLAVIVNKTDQETVPLTVRKCGLVS